MNIQYLLQDNASYDILPDRSDVQSSAHDRINLQSSPLTTSQAQLEVTASLQSSPSAQDPRFSTNATPNHDDNQDVNEENPDAISHACDSQELRLPDNASDQHSFYGNNSLEGHIASERQDGVVRLSSVAEHRRNRRRGEETEIGETGRRLADQWMVCAKKVDTWQKLLVPSLPRAMSLRLLVPTMLIRMWVSFLNRRPFIICADEQRLFDWEFTSDLTSPAAPSSCSGTLLRLASSDKTAMR